MYHSGRYKCEYGPKDYSRIVKPITAELLPKPRKKLRKPDVPLEGNLVAPTRKARAKRAKVGDGRKPPRRFKSKTPATHGDATESVVENPVQSPKKRSIRKKKGCCDNGGVPGVGNEGSCEAAIPDLNELPSVCDPEVPPLKVVRKRGPGKKKCESHSPLEAVGPASVTGITGDSVIDPKVPPLKVVRKHGPRKKKCETHSPLESVGSASVTAITADVKQAKPRCPRKKKTQSLWAVILNLAVVLRTDGREKSRAVPRLTKLVPNPLQEPTLDPCCLPSVTLSEHRHPQRTVRER